MEFRWACIEVWLGINEAYVFRAHLSELLGRVFLSQSKFVGNRPALSEGMSVILIGL